jgi:RNA polymerase sigma-70 factor (ECF subfamily)
MVENTGKEFSLEALRAGDKAEFARLVEAYSTPIYRLALKMLANPQEAEDVLQMTFLKAFQHIREFEGRSSLSTWLYRIAANEALMLLRRRRPEVSLEDEPDDEQLPRPFQFADWGHLPELELLSAEAKKWLDRAIEKLPEKLRVVFLLRDVEGLSIKETSEALSLTETAVKTRLLRARLRLREQLSTYFVERLSQENKNEA